MLYFQKEKLRMNEEGKIKNENEENGENKQNGSNDNKINSNFKDISEEEKKNNNKSININGIIISDISNPTKKKKN